MLPNHNNNQQQPSEDAQKIKDHDYEGNGNNQDRKDVFGVIGERNVRFLDECGSSFVLVDIDSLIDQAIYESEISGIDWNDHGGQWLHMFFYCEAKLREWRKSGVGFQLLYLKGNDPIARGKEELNSKRLLRHLLFYHLKKSIDENPELKKRHSCFVMHENIYENFEEFRKLSESVNVNSIVISSYNRDLLALLLNYCSIPLVSGITGEGSAINGRMFYLRTKERRRITFDIDGLVINSTPMEIGKMSVIQLFEKAITDSLSSNLDHLLAKVIVITKLLQGYLPLNYRYQKVDFAVAELNEFIQRFYGKLFEIAYHHEDYIEGSDDLLDGRLAHSILLWMIQTKQNEFTLPEHLQSQYKEIVSRLGLGESQANLLETMQQIPTSSSFQYEFENDHQVLPISNRFMSELFDIPESIIERNSNKKVFKDEYHYHNTEKISSVPEPRKSDETSTSLAKLIASFDRPKKRVVVAEQYTSKDIKEEIKTVQKKANYFKATLPKRIDGWKEEMSQINSSKAMLALSSSIFEELVYLKRLERKIVKTEASDVDNGIKQVFELLSLTLFAQLELIQANKDDLIQVGIWVRFIYSFLEEYSLNLPKVKVGILFEKLVNECFRFKLFSSGNEIIQRKSLKLKQRSEKDSIDIIQMYKETCELNSFFIPHPQQFSLQRVLNALEDDTDLSRMTPEEYRAFKIRQRMREDMDFIPDEWQEELINHVNKENVSVLCNVPTSQGKTFICFYLIEKVLRESSTDVICFIVPTKALVNQIYCEISSRFERNNLVGMATASKRINEFTSQVLIITPAMLEIYLMSSQENNWKSRIKYLIIDEIHSAFDGDQSQYYEHIIQFLDCPILGLSATLDNRNELAEWMKHGKRQIVETVHLEDYKRFNPLEYYNFNNDNEGKCIHVHPLALVNVNNLKQELELLNGMSMKECLELTQYLEKEIPSWFTEIVQIGLKSDLLEPFKWADSINYRRKVHEYLIEKGQDDNNHDNICKIIQHFYHLSLISTTERSEKLHEEEIINLVMQMKNENMLPSISFAFNRTLINDYLEYLVNYLETNQTNLWKDGKIPKTISQLVSSIEEGNCDFEVEELHFRALKVGLACHYAAMDENYQIEVERLFRIGDIPLIFSTSTLALGVNMPCKTVVICGFSPFYSNSLFKQACGRAGRRGFDNKGRVILCGFNTPLQRRYLLSPPVLVNGSQGFPTSFTLRLFSSLSQQGNNSSIEEGIKRLLDKPLFSLDKNLVDRAAKQMKHLFLFNSEYLFQTEFLNGNCEPLSLSGLVTHLFYLNEKAFTIPHLVKFKFFEQFKQVYSDTEQDLLLLKIVTYLMYRSVVGSYFNKKHTIQLGEENMEEGSIFREMAEHVKSHNDMALSIFSNFASVYAVDKQDELEDVHLPLSNHGNFKKLRILKSNANSSNETKEENVGGGDDDWESFDVEETEPVESEQQVNEPVTKKFVLDESEFESDLHNIPLIKHLSSHCIRNNLSISSFAALSGNMDGHYKSVDHFLQTLNHNICLNKTTIPLQDLEFSKLNSFLIDLYKHKNIKLLKAENGFSTKHAATREVEQIVKDLKKIRSSLIVEKCFKESTFYHPYMDSSIKTLLDDFGIQWAQNYQALYDCWRKETLNSVFDSYFIQTYKYQKFLKILGSLFRHPFMKSLDRVIRVLSEIIYGRPVYVNRKKKDRPDMPNVDDESEHVVNVKSKTEAKVKKPQDE